MLFNPAYLQVDASDFMASENVGIGLEANICVSKAASKIEPEINHLILAT